MELLGDGTSELSVTPATAKEWLTAEEWAAEEQWNPGIGDTDCFHPTDTGGFFLGRRDGDPVSSVSVVNYSDDYAFLGYYIVRPEVRGTGLGKTTWDAAMPHAGGRTVGLDGVLEQVDTYKRSGFVPAYGNCRYGGRPSRGTAPASVVPVTEHHLDALAAYDAECFPAPRPEFLRRWLTAPGHTARVLIEDGRPAGYGVVRPARDGHRIGPFFADTPQAAEGIFDALIAGLGDEDVVHFDVPEPNEAAVALAASRGLEPGFRSVRMYKGTAPELPLERIFGVTSLELG
jgi:hypothetical protein